MLHQLEPDSSTDQDRTKIMLPPHRFRGMGFGCGRGVRRRRKEEREEEEAEGSNFLSELDHPDEKTCQKKEN